jgi:uncharacterized RDD family membrane protein YckC
LVYAGFWLRFAAWLIDYVLLYVVFMVVTFVVSLLVGIVAGFAAGLHKVDSDDLQQNPMLLLLYAFLLVLFVVGSWLYYAFQEAGKHQATLGKRAVQLMVTDRQGARIGFGRATGRFFGKIVSALPFYIGFMLAGWTQRKQALHDMMADTLVVRKPRA